MILRWLIYCIIREIIGLLYHRYIYIYTRYDEAYILRNTNTVQLLL